jgi:hypothetical protein
MRPLSESSPHSTLRPKPSDIPWCPHLGGAPATLNWSPKLCGVAITSPDDCRPLSEVEDAPRLSYHLAFADQELVSAALVAPPRT